MAFQSVYREKEEKKSTGLIFISADLGMLKRFILEVISEQHGSWISTTLIYIPKWYYFESTKEFCVQIGCSTTPDPLFEGECFF